MSLCLISGWILVAQKGRLREGLLLALVGHRVDPLAALVDLLLALADLLVDHLAALQDPLLDRVVALVD